MMVPCCDVAISGTVESQYGQCHRAHPEVIGDGGEGGGVDG